MGAGSSSGGRGGSSGGSASSRTCTSRVGSGGGCLAAINQLADHTSRTLNLGLLLSALGHLVVLGPMANEGTGGRWACLRLGCSIALTALLGACLLPLKAC